MGMVGEQDVALHIERASMIIKIPMHNDGVSREDKEREHKQSL